MIYLSIHFSAGHPNCQSLEFLGSIIEGQRLSFVASYTGGYTFIKLLETYVIVRWKTPQLN